MYTYTAETGDIRNYGTNDTPAETLARESARRDFGYHHDTLPADERASYIVTGPQETQTGAQRYVVATVAGDALTVFVGTREQIDALYW